jgi:hypothetical protein
MITPSKIAPVTHKSWPDGTERHSPLLEYLIVVLKKVRVRRGGFNTFRVLYKRYEKSLSPEELCVFLPYVRVHDPLFYNENLRTYTL